MAVNTALNPRELSTALILGTRRRQMVLLAAAVTALSLLLIRLVLWFDLATIFGFAVWIGLVALVVQPRFGLYTLLAIELLFETATSDSLMIPGGYLNNSIQNSSGANGLILIPMEMLLLLVT